MAPASRLSVSSGTTTSALDGGQVTEQVGAVTADGCHAGAATVVLVTCAHHLLLAGDRADRVRELGDRLRTLVRRDAHHPAQRRQHEQLEGDVRRHGVAGQREDRGAVLADVAEALRLARLHPHPAEPHGAELGEHLLDHVVLPHAHPAAGDHHVGADELVGQRVAEVGGVVGDDADPVGDGAGLADRGGEHVGVRVVDRVVRQLAAGLAQLGAGRHDDHARTRPGAHLRPADAREQRRADAGRRIVPSSRSTSPSRTSSPRRRTCWPGCGRLARCGRSRHRRRSTRPGRPRRRPAGTGAPVMILTAVPGDIAKSLVWPAAASPTTGRCTGSDSLACSTSAVTTA